MDVKRHLVETCTLVVAAALCATVSNALASRERKIAWKGAYTDALTVPAEKPEMPVTAPVEAPATAAPGAPPLAPAPDAVHGPATQPLSATPAAVPAAQPRTAPSGPPAARVTSARGTAPSAAPPAADLLSRFPPHKDKPWVELSGADVALLHSAGALFLDARRTSVYEEGHIALARSYSVWEADVDDKVNALLAEGRDPSQPVVIYCSGGDCEDSHMLAQKLSAVFDNLYVYRDGFPDWLKRGGATKTGAAP